MISVVKEFLAPLERLATIGLRMVNRIYFNQNLS